MRKNTIIVAVSSIALAGSLAGNVYGYKTINELNEKTSNLSATIEKHETVIAQNIDTINDLSNVVDELEASVVEKDAAITSKDKKIAQDKQTITSRDATIQSLKKQLAQEKVKTQQSNQNKQRSVQKTNVEPINQTARAVSSGAVKTMTMTATAYTAFDPGSNGITATGDDISSSIYVNGMRVIAVDRNVIPLYSICMVYPKSGSPFKAIALDVGGAVKGNIIDVLVSVNDKSVARSFGRQHGVRVDILRWGK